MTVRFAKGSDAENLLKLFERLDSQTSFMLLEPGERSTSITEQENIISDFHTSKNKLMAVYESNIGLAGFIIAIAGNYSRNRHTAHMVLGVDRQYWNQGLGSALINFMESWALDAKVHRIEFTVIEENKAARSLYRKLGYVEEGRRRDSLKINGQFVNEYYMSKLLKSESTIA